MHEGVEFRALVLCLLHAFAHQNQGSRKDFHEVWIASELLHPAFHVGVKSLARREIGLRREHGFRRLRRDLSSGFRGAGLHDHRPALDRSRNIERAAHRQILALVVQHVQLVRIEIRAAFDITDESVVCPAVPKPGHDVEEFARPLVALAVLHVIVETEIQRGIRIGRGHEIPPRPTATDMVERGEFAGDVIGLVERGRGGRDETEPLGDDSQRRQQRQRIKRGDGVAALQAIDWHVQNGQMVGHEERIELGAPAFARSA